MKKLLKLLFLFVFATISITACNKTDYNDDNWAEEQRLRDSLDSIRIEELLEQQAPILEDFAAQYIPGAEMDDSTGIWFKVHEPGEEGSYTRWLIPGSMGGLTLARPTVEVKYTGRLLNGNVFDETSADDPDDETRTFQIGNDNMGRGLIPAWNIAFYPNKVLLNGNEYNIGGLTENGLQKGAIIEFVTPSPYAYDNAESDEIPADSPLHFYIEVVDIE